jgi:hypothetical protein
MAKLVGKCTVEITNGKSVEAFVEAVALVDRIVKDQPWNDDAREAASNLRIAAEGIKLVQ